MTYQKNVNITIRMKRSDRIPEELITYFKNHHFDLILWLDDNSHLEVPYDQLDHINDRLN